MYNPNFNQQARLQVPYNGVDQSTMSNQLPQGNERVPNVQLSQWMGANQQIGLLAIGTLRMHAQNSIQRSGTHCAAYNLLAQNGFNNQVWLEYSQSVVDLSEFLCVVKQYQPQEAVKMAGQRVYEALLGTVFATYGAELQNEQVTPSGYWAGLQTAMSIKQTIDNDIRQYKSGGFNRPTYNQQDTGQLAPISYTQPQQQNAYHIPPNNAGMSNFQTSSYVPNGMNQATGGYQTSSNNNSVDSSFYSDPTPVKPLQPVEEINSDNGFYNVNAQQETPKMQTFTQQEEVEYTDLPMPRTVDEVVVDPAYYVPSNVKVNFKRPYDQIFNPGGVEIRPAYNSQWEVTMGDDMPWLQLADPSRFCVFHVKFPDGVVKEKFVEWNPSMEYQRHELDAEMQRKAHRPNGIVVANEIPISTVGGDAIAETDLLPLIKDGHLKRSAVPPVLLTKTYTGSTDMDIERQVVEDLTNLLEVNFSKDIPTPEAEYRSTYLHPITVSEEGFSQLILITKQEELGQVALAIKELVTQGIISMRLYNFINDRYTKAINGVLRDDLSMTVDITDFCEDYIELEEYLTTKRGEQLVSVLRGAAQSVNNQALCLMDETDEDTVNYYIADNYLNHQMGWTLDELATPNIRQGKPVLISASAHPTLLEVLKGMISRANKAEEFIVGKMRLFTADGHCLEVIRGRLVAKAVLLKLVK